MSTAYIDAAVAGELEELRQASSGNRNKTLFRTAARLYQFVEADALDRNDVTALLEQAAGQLKLERREVRATLKSAQKQVRGQAAQLGHNVRRAQSLPGAVLEPEAPEVAELPPLEWQRAAHELCGGAMRRLWEGADRRPMGWLWGRKLHFDTVMQGRLGYNAHDYYDTRERWGLEGEKDARGRPKQVWVPRGITIPWFVEGRIWKVFIRRPLTEAQIAAGEPKYVQLPGGTNALYNADKLKASKSAMLVEGALDALAVQQVAGDLVIPVASGTTGARRVRWIAALAARHCVLLSFDADAAGNEATAYWQSVLGNVAQAWQPYLDDPATMLQADLDLRLWIKAGLHEANG
jgi:hypothetical protein